LKGRGAPKLQTAGKAARPAAETETVEAAPGEKRHSLPVQFKIKAPHARSVQLAGAFLVRGSGRREMAQQDDGTWALTLYLLPGTSYRYWFVVNGKKTLDPENSQVERGASVLVLP
jgi:1,4-alpha-glucan branching enzyme